MGERATLDTLYLAEQRRYRRLEVSLPVWLAEEGDFKGPGVTQWSLGYTRDISLGGARIIVPNGEEQRWRDVSLRNGVCLLRFDAPGCGAGQTITGRVKHTQGDENTGRVWLGIEYDEGCEAEKATSVRAGLRTVKVRQRWQGAFVLAMMVAGWFALAVASLNDDIKQRDVQIQYLKNEHRRLERSLIERSLNAAPQRPHRARQPLG
jgi:hypothetical protein